MSCESCRVFAMTRGVAALIAVLIAGSTDGTWARDRNDHRALNASLLSDVTSCSVATAKQVPGREGVTIRDARFEGASPIEDSPSVMLRFVVRNDTTARINGVIVSVSLFSVAGRMLDTSVLLRPPLRVRVNASLAVGYSLDYQIRLKNLSLESACMSEVVIVGDAVSPIEFSSAWRRSGREASTPGLVPARR